MSLAEIGNLPPAQTPGPTIVVAGLIWQGGRLLVAQRPRDRPLGGLWEFPGGKREPGEDDRTALARELHEELGTWAEVGPLAWQQAPVPATGGQRLVLHFYHARLLADAPAPQPLCSQQLAWRLPQDLGALAFCPADAALVAALAAGEVAPPANV